MKQLRFREVGLIVAGILCGFAIGIYTYLAFFLLPGEARNGIAMFIASIFGLIGTTLMVLIRAEGRREDKFKEKPDA